ncbi:hypothetical protein ACWEQ4_01555 [Rhodococcus sp. NPDC003994]
MSSSDLRSLLPVVARLNTYDAYGAAEARGMTVGFEPFTTTPLVILPGDNAVILSNILIKSSIDRHDAIAYGIVWLEVFGTRLMQRCRRGLEPTSAVVDEVRRIASRRLVYTDALRSVLHDTSDMEEAAAALGVGTAVLADRVRNLSAREHRAFGQSLIGSRWPAELDTITPRYVTIGIEGFALTAEEIEELQARRRPLGRTRLHIKRRARQITH